MNFGIQPPGSISHGVSLVSGLYRTRDIICLYESLIPLFH